MTHFNAFMPVKPGYANQGAAKKPSKHHVSLQAIDEILRGLAGFSFERRPEGFRRVPERFQPE